MEWFHLGENMNHYQIFLTVLIALILTTMALILIEKMDATPYSETKATYPVNVFATDDIKDEFNQIYMLPYDVEDMNCKDKAGLFVKVLKENGATDIKIMDIARQDGEGGHEVVLWNNNVYDPTSGIWNMSRTDYINMIQSKGFNGTLIEVTV